MRRRKIGWRLVALAAVAAVTSPVECAVPAPANQRMARRAAADILPLLDDAVGRPGIFIDAWGRRADWFHLNVGTTIDGSVDVRPLENGRVLVSVTALTRNAICWGTQQAGAGYVAAFGHNPGYLSTHLETAASLGDALHKYVFSAPADAPLPPNGAIGSEGYPIESMSAVVNCSGVLRAGSGYPEGTPGKAHVTQEGWFTAGRTGHCPAGDCWPAEVVNFWPVIAR